MTTFQKEILEVKNLNNKYKSYWEREFGDRDYSQIISNLKNFIEVIKQGLDGIRYYDPDATGEEFVLFNITKVQFTI